VNPRDPTSQYLLASVDQADAVTLVLEFPRNREDSPAALLALIFVGWKPIPGVIAPPKGPYPTLTVSTTVLLAVSITETVPSPLLVMCAQVPSGVIATPKGTLPTATVAVTALLAVSITETEEPNDSSHRRGFR
jgi:hypothetical protein